jgi:hypothetical protein
LRPTIGTQVIDRSGADDPDADCGTVFAIRSERRLCTEVQVNLAYRWFASSASRMGYPTIVRRRIKAMGIQDKPISAGLCGRTALPRLIGSISRECVDHLVVFGEQHLHSVLRSYAHYYRCLAS